MKIHSNKFKEDFNSYFNDFESSLKENLGFHKSRANNLDFFTKIYPLFVLLESLTNYEYFVDPSKKILIGEYLEDNNREELIKVARTLFNKDVNSEVLLKGIQKATFTPYFKELYSDSLLLMNQFYLNNYRGCYLYLRCILEDLYRHLYYKDHKEEFFMIDSDIAGLSPKELRDYLPKTSFLDKLKDVNENFELKEGEQSVLFKLNDNLYRDTSAFVHASKETYMSKYNFNSDLRYDENNASAAREIALKIVNLSIVFLICAHFEQFSRFNDFEKSLILINFNKDAKSNLRKFLNF